jgi:hypothetical protein
VTSSSPDWYSRSQRSDAFSAEYPVKRREKSLSECHGLSTCLILVVYIITSELGESFSWWRRSAMHFIREYFIC